MHFTPKSEKEVAEAGLWPAGNYPFEILTAQDKISKAGKEMIELKIQIFNDEGQHKIIFDYLMEAIPHKLRHAAHHTGLGEKYDGGYLNADDFVGRTGQAKVIIQKDKTGAYPDKNSIVDYLENAVIEPAKVATSVKEELNDDIPWQ